eukprot:4957365-Prymnesium_polylepis.2
MAHRTQYSPLLSAAVQLGACCHVGRGAARNSVHEGFEISELRQSADNDRYMRASDGDPAGSMSLLSIYASQVSALIA